jgi:succinate-acetate transporter protein
MSIPAPKDSTALPVGAQVVLRPLANPLSLGFLALATATFLLSGVQLEWVPASDAATVAVILIAFVAPLQLVAAIFGFLARDPVAGTGMGILAGTWAAVGLVALRSPVGATSEALGLLLLASGVVMLVPALGAIDAKVVPALVLGTTALRFVLTGVYQLSDNTGWKVAAGVLGVVLCALALYAATAFMVEETRHRTWLPLGRRNEGRRAITGDLDRQLANIAKEAGIREQL